MIKLIINQSGLFLTLPGLPSFRTPAEIDITKFDINFIMTEMRRNGINDYNIISSTKIKPVKPENQKEKPPQKSVKVETTPKDTNVDLRLNSIESLLKQLVDKDPINLDESTTKRVKRIIEEDDAEFIPSINVDLEMEGDMTSEEDSIEDVSENADLLSKISKRGDKNG